MTFLYGRTTRGLLQNKLLDLISGQAADDQGTVTAVSDRWRVRLTGLSGDGSFAPPASNDELVTQEHRQGYWGRYDDCCIYTDGSASGMEFMQQLTCWTGWHTNFRDWLICTARITTSNTTAGDYSTARVQFYAVALYSSKSSGGVASAVTITPAVDGTCTYTYTSGYTITFKIGNSVTGKVLVGSYYIRSFTNRYRGGVDWWHRASKNVDSSYSFTTGDAPVGVDGTDWEVNIGPNQYGCPNGDGSTNFYQYMASPVGNISGAAPSAGSSGLGIMTNSALTGSHYEVSFTKQEGLATLIQSGAYVYLRPGGVGKGPDGTTFIRAIDGNDLQSTGNSFLYHNASSDSSTVQYWLSVSSTGIGVVLYGEGASSWQTTANLYAKVVPGDPSYGSCWMFGNLGYWWNWFRNGSHALIEVAMSRGKGYYDGGRDWQTGQGRHDMFPMAYCQYWYSGSYGSQMFCYSETEVNYIQSPGGSSSGSFTPIIPFNVNRTTKPPLSFPWTLSGFSLMDTDNSGMQDTTTGRVGKYMYRGYVAGGIYWMSSGGYAQGDELTDSISGAKYLLWNSSNATFPGNSTYATGFALEEK